MAIECEVSDVRDRVRAAFKSLRKQGFVARMNFSCCSNCAGHAIANDLEEMEEAKRQKVKGAVFYHKQSAQSFKEGHDLYIIYGTVSAGDTTYGIPTVETGQAAVRALRAEGCVVDWDGDPAHTIKVINKVYCNFTPEIIEAIHPLKNGTPVPAMTPTKIAITDLSDNSSEIRRLIHFKLTEDGFEAIADEFEARARKMATAQEIVSAALEFVTFADDVKVA